MHHTLTFSSRSVLPTYKFEISSSPYCASWNAIGLEHDGIYRGSLEPAILFIHSSNISTPPNRSSQCQFLSMYWHLRQTYVEPEILGKWQRKVVSCLRLTSKAVSYKQLLLDLKVWFQLTAFLVSFQRVINLPCHKQTDTSKLISLDRAILYHGKTSTTWAIWPFWSETMVFGFSAIYSLTKIYVPKALSELT